MAVSGVRGDVCGGLWAKLGSVNNYKLNLADCGFLMHGGPQGMPPFLPALFAVFVLFLRILPGLDGCQRLASARGLWEMIIHFNGLLK